MSKITERPRNILTAKQGQEILKIKAHIGTESRHAVSILIVSQYGISSKAIRNIWKGRSWLNTTYDLWPNEDSPVRKIVGRPKGKKNSRVRNNRARNFTFNSTQPSNRGSECIVCSSCYLSQFFESTCIHSAIRSSIEWL